MRNYGQNAWYVHLMLGEYNFDQFSAKLRLCATQRAVYDRKTLAKMDTRKEEQVVCVICYMHGTSVIAQWMDGRWFTIHNNYVII